MIESIIILVLVGLLAYSVIKVIYDYKKERKELEQEYENVKIGDKYKSVYHNDNPFEGATVIPGPPLTEEEEKEAAEMAKKLLVHFGVLEEGEKLPSEIEEEKKRVHEKV